MTKEMKVKKYDKIAYEKIYELYKKGKVNQAKQFIIEYIETYPTDVNSKILLSKILIALKEYKEAEKFLEYCMKKYPEYIIFKQNMVYLYIELEEYEKAYEIYTKINFEKYEQINKKSTIELATLHALLYTKLNIRTNQKEGYLVNQYKNYDKKMAIKHICINHLNNKKSKNDYMFFKDKEEIEELLEKVEKRIEKNAQKEQRLDVVDYYNFKCENIGISQAGYTDILKVVTIKNTNNIITMYPIKKESAVIINELEEAREYTSGKIRKRTSQIDKFKQKYKI